MPKKITRPVEQTREVWSIAIRLDLGPAPRLEVKSEWVERDPATDHRRVVPDKPLPNMTAPAKLMDEVPVTLSDGHKTTLGVLLAALADAAEAAVDQLEAHLEAGGEARPCCLHERLTSHPRFSPQLKVSKSPKG